MGTSLPEKLPKSIIANSSKDKLQVPTTVTQNLSLLQPLKAPKSYGTYSRQQQGEVIAFIKDGNSLRTAEKHFGIPKSTMHCWLKKVPMNSHVEHDGITSKYNQPLEVDTYSMVNTLFNEKEDSSRAASPPPATPPATTNTKTLLTKTSPLLIPPSHTNRINAALPNGTANKKAPIDISPTTLITSDSPVIEKSTKANQKPETQIVIEEAELIRFLQTGEGAVLIGKAYNLPVLEFLNFVKNSQLVKRETNTKQSVKSDVMVTSLATNMNTSPYSFSSMRKRNFTDSGCNCQQQQQSAFRKNITELKKPKLDSPPAVGLPTLTINKTGGLLESLLTRPRGDANKLKPSNNLVLTEEQIKTSNKLISQAQPGIVNTYLVTVPLTSLPSSLTPASKANDDIEECELSPTYPKMVNPVSIKAERGETDCIMRPPCSLPLVNKTTLLNQATKPIVSTNAKAALNLNEINRSQSERDLMALVDDDVVSADELCTDFNETLELNKWVHNENWYTDQYLQHFQTFPSTTTITTSQQIANTSQDISVTPAATPAITEGASLMKDENNDDFDFEEDDDDDDDGVGITFASVNDKDKIISYLSDGNDIVEAEKHFSIPQTTITRWLGSVDQKPNEKEQKQQQQQQQQQPDSNNSGDMENLNIEIDGEEEYQLLHQKSAFSFHKNKQTDNLSTNLQSEHSTTSAFSRLKQK